MAQWRGVELSGLLLSAPRLTLRPWQLSDAASVLAVMADPRMREFLLLPSPYDAQAARTFVGQIGPGSAATGTGLDLAVTDTRSGRLIGAAGLHKLAGDSDRVEIGYWIGSDDWGRGYAAEATSELARFAFAQGARRAQIVCDIANLASAAVAMKAGFRFEGVLRAEVTSTGGPADGAIFARLPGDAVGPVYPAWPALASLTDGTVSLRKMGAGDGAVLLANQTNAEARRWALSDGQLGAESAETLARLAALHWLVGSETQLVICEATTGIAAGTMTLRRSGPPDVVGIGYGILPGFRGRGYTSRSLNLLADWAFDSAPIQRLELGCKVENIASAIAAERAGFIREGIFEGRLANPAGGYSDEIRFARVRGGSRSVGQGSGLPGVSLNSDVSRP